MRFMESLRKDALGSQFYSLKYAKKNQYVCLHGNKLNSESIKNEVKASIHIKIISMSIVIALSL